MNITLTHGSVRQADRSLGSLSLPTLTLFDEFQDDEITCLKKTKNKTNKQKNPTAFKEIRLSPGSHMYLHPNTHTHTDKCTHLYTQP